MMKIKVYTLNAFVKEGRGGNPAGVVLSADLIRDAEMQHIAKKVGFSETAFILKSHKADYRLRYFTPAGEVPLCGHATVAAFGMLAIKGSIAAGRYKLETKAGILNVEILKDKKILMDQNLPEFYEVIDKNEIAESLKIPVEAICSELPVQVVSTGLKDIIVPVRSLKELLEIRPYFHKIAEVSRKYGGAGYHVFTTETKLFSTAHCRNFAPLYDIPEESATGTASGALACYMYKYGLLNAGQAENIIFEQGYSMNRPSEIYASMKINDGKISGVKVGGRTGEISEMEIEI
jgi:PhzF family phenazine biosynthesis protein